MTLENEVERDAVREDEVFEEAEVGIPEVGRRDCDEPGRGSGLSDFRDTRPCTCCWIGKAVGGGPARVVVGLSSVGGTGGGRGLSSSSCDAGLAKVCSPPS